MTDVMRGWGRATVDLDPVTGNAYLLVKVAQGGVMGEAMRGTGRLMMDFDPSTGNAYPLIKVVDGGGTYNPKRSVAMQEDFLASGTTSGVIGEYGWNASGGASAVLASETNRPGLFRRSTNSSTVIAAMFLRSGVGTGMFDPALPFTAAWSGRLNQVDNDVVFRMGLGNSTTGNPPNDGIYLEKLSADTNWFVVTRASSTQTGSRIDTGIAITTDFVDLVIQRTTAGVLFTVNGAALAVITANITTVMLQPIFNIQSPAAGDKSADADYFGITAQVTR